MKSLFKTVFIVTALSCFERFLGFLYRIYLSRSLGSEGLGLYQITLSILGLFMTITSSGIPITVSRMMIKYREEKKYSLINGVVSSGILTAILISLPITVFTICDCPLITCFFSDSRCVELLKTVIWGLTITSVYAVFRGSFWGNGRFFTYGIIELLEEAVMVIFGIILINTSTNLSHGVNRAMLAVLISYIFSFVLSATVYFTKGGKLSSPTTQLRPLFSSSAPITCMRTATSLINTLIAVLLPSQLIKYGMSEAYAVSEFGKVFGMAFPLIFMPSTLIGSLALVLVPELSANYYSAKYKTLKLNIEKAVKFSIFTVCLIIPVFLFGGKSIGRFLYNDAKAGEYVVLGAVTMFPMSICIITTSILNSLNKEKETLIFYLSGASVLILSILFLPKYFGVNSLIIGMILSYGITAILNLRKVSKICPVKINLTAYIIKSSIIIIPSFLSGYFLNNVLSVVASELFSLIICSVVSVTFSLTLFNLFNMNGFYRFPSLKRAPISFFKKGKRENKST